MMIDEFAVIVWRRWPGDGSDRRKMYPFFGVLRSDELAGHWSGSVDALPSDVIVLGLTANRFGGFEHEADRFRDVACSCRGDGESEHCLGGTVSRRCSRCRRWLLHLDRQFNGSRQGVRMP